jgi:AraC-like DNA-binding protein
MRTPEPAIDARADYDSPSAFTTMFQRQSGTAPSRYFQR